MLTGENGILTQAQNSQTQTEIGREKEDIALAYNGAVLKNVEEDAGDVTAKDLNDQFDLNGVTDATATGSNPITVTFDSGNQYTIDANGNITGPTTGTTPPATGSTLGTVTGDETSNTTVQDSLGNQVVVPAGFVVGNPNDNVEDGIYIVDSDNTRATYESEFVWIPTGTIHTENNGDITINLDRYDFSNNVAGEAKGNSDINEYSGDPCQELDNTDSTYANVKAKSISDFLAKADSIEKGGSGGFYIGRYEARNNSNAVIVDKAHNVYNNVTQSQAADLSKNMYSSSNFTSDLVNSYAWDTALVFIQECEDEDYSQQNSLNKSLSLTGTTNDVVCNIYDMASNCYEWSTETAKNTTFPCVARGGGYDYSDYLASSRFGDGTTSNNDSGSFRPLLYL